MKKTPKYFVRMLAVIMLMIGATVFARADSEGPEMSIQYCNLSFRDSVCIKYAVASDSLEKTTLLLWDTPSDKYLYGTHVAELETVGNQTINGVSYKIFDYTELAAKQMTDVVYACAYTVVDGKSYYSKVEKYSILDYAYNKLGKTATASTDEKFKAMLSSMLVYGADTQKYFDYKTDRLATNNFYQVKVVGGLIDDQCDHGLYLKGEKVNLIAPTADKDGVAFSYWANKAGKAVARTAEATVTVEAINDVYTAVYEKTSVGLEFDSNGDGTCCLVGIGECSDTDIIIPEVSPAGDKVTSIDSSAFANLTITSVTIPTSIKEIGRKAFNGCTSLTDVYYDGSEEEWKALLDAVGTGNDALVGANVHYSKTTYYTVTFKDHDGTVLDTQKIASGKAATAPSDPCRDGYTFTGWDKTFDRVTESMTVTAVYQKNEVSYANPTFVVGNATASAGEQVEVLVEIKKNPGLFGAILTFTFDSKLTLESSSAGSAFDEFVMTPPGSLTSPCNFLWDGQATPATKDGEILKLVFKISDEATSGEKLKINCSYVDGDVVDSNFVATDLDIVSGTVTVR